MENTTNKPCQSNVLLSSSKAEYVTDDIEEKEVTVSFLNEMNEHIEDPESVQQKSSNTGFWGGLYSLGQSMKRYNIITTAVISGGVAIFAIGAAALAGAFSRTESHETALSNNVLPVSSANNTIPYDHVSPGLLPHNDTLKLDIGMGVVNKTNDELVGKIFNNCPPEYLQGKYSKEIGSAEELFRRCNQSMETTPAVKTLKSSTRETIDPVCDKLANKNDTDTQYMIGMMSVSQQKMTKAVESFQQSAKPGNFRSMFMVAEMQNCAEEYTASFKSYQNLIDKFNALPEEDKKLPEYEVANEYARKAKQAVLEMFIENKGVDEYNYKNVKWTQKMIAAEKNIEFCKFIITKADEGFAPAQYLVFSAWSWYSHFDDTNDEVCNRYINRLGDIDGHIDRVSYVKKAVDQNYFPARLSAAYDRGADKKLPIYIKHFGPWRSKEICDVFAEAIRRGYRVEFAKKKLTEWHCL